MVRVGFNPQNPNFTTSPTLVTIMTKVYGTGTYDFRRHRVAEYPVATPAEPKAASNVTAGGSGAVPSSITLSEIQRDRLTKIAEANWLTSGEAAAAREKKELDPDLVRKIYETELLVKEGSKPVPLQRVMILEVSQYLENYLWPHFDPLTATFEHVMSIIIMVNEKVLSLLFSLCVVSFQSHSCVTYIVCLASSSVRMLLLGLASIRGKTLSKAFLRGFFA